MGKLEPTFIYAVCDGVAYLANDSFTQLWKISTEALLERLPVDLPDSTGFIRSNHNFFSLNWPGELSTGSVSIAGFPLENGLRSSKTAVSSFPGYLRMASLSCPVYQRLTEEGTSGVYDLNEDRLLFDGLKLRDVGDLTPDYTNDTRLLDAACRQIVIEHLVSGSSLVAIGGEHTLTLHLVSALIEAAKDRIVVVIFDAHHDGGTAFDSEQPNYANFVAHLLTNDYIAAVVQVGLRSLRSPSQMLRHPKIRQLSAERATVEALSELLEQVAEETSTRMAYLSVDLDCLDPAHFPHVDFPLPGGFDPKRLIELLSCVFARDWELPVLDIVEGSLRSYDDSDQIHTHLSIPLQIVAHCLDQYKKR